ncbi:hypothetical protein [Thermoflexibacter ruber]|uniref:GLPGLI family protein n=1 Tax=Thermoflexibacter ruber TaxID=1003 RepID=A0A1I2I8X2_9BACT|nr:hypothetical protein [Thermoflexibacter ruber]SFF38103.1 hypothetical protein SAMN04488541_102942 [Thermoflexibacter ruber]
MKHLYFVVIALFFYACASDSQNAENQIGGDSTATFQSISTEIRNIAFQSFIQNFHEVSLPYQVASIPSVQKLSKENHQFLRNQINGKQIINVPNEFEGLWKRTHHDKFNIGAHKPMGGASLIAQNENFILVEISDLEEFNYRDSLYTYRKTTFLCSFNPQGEYINGIAACYADGDPMGAVERKTTIDKSLKINIQELGYEKMKLPNGYKLDAQYQVQEDGKFVYLDSRVVK